MLIHVTYHFVCMICMMSIHKQDKSFFILSNGSLMWWVSTNKSSACYALSIVWDDWEHASLSSFSHRMKIGTRQAATNTWAWSLFFFTSMLPTQSHICPTRCQHGSCQWLVERVQGPFLALLSSITNVCVSFSYGPGEIDLLVLPEMAFTGRKLQLGISHISLTWKWIGYVFESSQEIEPYLEDEETGPSVIWAKKQGKNIQYIIIIMTLLLIHLIAVRLQSFVVVGYPERTKGKG